MIDLSDTYERLARPWSQQQLAERYQEAYHRGARLRPAADDDLDRPIVLLATAIPPSASLSVAVHVFHALPAGAQCDLASQLVQTAETNAAAALHRCHRALELDAGGHDYTADEWLPVLSDMAASLLESANLNLEPPTIVRRHRKRSATCRALCSNWIRSHEKLQPRCPRRSLACSLFGCSLTLLALAATISWGRSRGSARSRVPRAEQDPGSRRGDARATTKAGLVDHRRAGPTVTPARLHRSGRRRDRLCNATLTMNRFTTLITLARASVARTMFGCPCSCSAVADVVVAIAQPSGIRTTRPRRSPASARSWIAAVSLRSSRSLTFKRRSPASIRAAVWPPARNPGTLSGLRAGRIVSQQPRGFVSDVAESGDRDHFVRSQIAVRPPSTWMIAPLM